MVTSTTHKLWTDEELMALPADGKHELVDGELLHMSPAGSRHGAITVKLSTRVQVFVEQRKLGWVFEGQTGFRLSNGNLRCPDVSFVSTARLSDGAPPGFLYMAPDLAVEVLSPTDRAADVAHKVGEYLAVGVRLLWVIDSEKRTAVVYRPGATPRSVSPEGALDGEDVLPDFSCRLADLFA